MSETGGNWFPLAKLIEKQKIDFRCISPEGNGYESLCYLGLDSCNTQKLHNNQPPWRAAVGA